MKPHFWDHRMGMLKIWGLVWPTIYSGITHAILGLSPRRFVVICCIYIYIYDYLSYLSNARTMEDGVSFDHFWEFLVWPFGFEKTVGGMSQIRFWNIWRNEHNKLGFLPFPMKMYAAVLQILLGNKHVTCSACTAPHFWESCRERCFKICDFGPKSWDRSLSLGWAKASRLKVLRGH